LRVEKRNSGKSKIVGGVEVAPREKTTLERNSGRDRPDRRSIRRKIIKGKIPGGSENP